MREFEQEVKEAIKGGSSLAKKIGDHIVATEENSSTIEIAAAGTLLAVGALKQAHIPSAAVHEILHLLQEVIMQVIDKQELVAKAQAQASIRKGEVPGGNN